MAEEKTTEELKAAQELTAKQSQTIHRLHDNAATLRRQLAVEQQLSATRTNTIDRLEAELKQAHADKASVYREWNRMAETAESRAGRRLEAELKTAEAAQATAGDDAIRATVSVAASTLADALRIVEESLVKHHTSDGRADCIPRSRLAPAIKILRVSIALAEQLNELAE